MSETFKLRVKDHIDAAHKLADYKGKCQRMHGHRWDVEVCIEGHKLDDINMLVDFKVVKSLMKELIDAVVHYVLNEQLGEENVTAEFLARWFYDDFAEAMNAVGMLSEQVKLVCATVWESPDCCIEYSPEQLSYRGGR